jgi:hypothetical protein
VFFVLIISGCNSNHSNIIGVYKSMGYKEYSFVKRVSMYFKKETYTKGQILVLLPDSMYYLQTCGNHISGKWKIKQGDTLLLFCERNRLRNDSLNKREKSSCGTEPEKYFINDDMLESWFYLKGTKAHDDLVKSQF